MFWAMEAYAFNNWKEVTRNLAVNSSVTVCSAICQSSEEEEDSWKPSCSVSSILAAENKTAMRILQCNWGCWPLWTATHGTLSKRLVDLGGLGWALSEGAVVLCKVFVPRFYADLQLMTLLPPLFIGSHECSDLEWILAFLAQLC